MKALNASALAVFRTLTRDLTAPGTDGCSRKFDNGGDGIMAACVEHIAPRRYSIAHYYVQNGDMMKDPDVVFYVEDDSHVYPATFEQSSDGTYQELIVFHADGRASFAKRQQADLASFCDTWLRNIADQQGLDIQVAS